VTILNPNSEWIWKSVGLFRLTFSPIKDYWRLIDCLLLLCLLLLPITYYWTVPLILDHSCLVGRLTSSKIADTKVSGFYKF
jgi:hypothetical protein